jgi:hypothetical protein
VAIPKKEEIDGMAGHKKQDQSDKKSPLGPHWPRGQFQDESPGRWKCCQKDGQPEHDQCDGQSVQHGERRFIILPAQ